MSEGKKFAKTDSNLTPEQRLDEIERKYEVIRERIQAYDQVLVEFANINSDLNAIKQELEINKSISSEYHDIFKERIGILNSKILSVHKNNESFSTHVDNQSKFNEKIDTSLQEAYNVFHRDIELLKVHVGDMSIEHANTKCHVNAVDERLNHVDPLIKTLSDKLNSLLMDHMVLKNKFDSFCKEQETKTESLIGSLQNLPQFNEWATKIYIKVCNEINDKQKAFYQELDKRSQLLREQLASDPYTAESVKKILKDEIDILAMDGKNAYLKVTNASQQIQLLEKKVENINLILKKYELSK